MLDINSKVTINGDSKVDGVIAERYTASIDQTNPENIAFTRVIVNGQLRKDNRKQCRKDQAMFEDDAYEVQNEMIEQASKVEEVAEAVEEAVEEAEEK